MTQLGRHRLARAWRRLQAAAPRRLRATSAGKALLALTLGCGLLALSQGNNLLFLVWGLQLGTVLVSGVLSELSLRPLQLRGALPARARVGERCHVPVQLSHGWRRLPSYALHVAVRVRTGAQSVWGEAPYVLRLEAASSQEVYAAFTPRHRGPLQLRRLVARTGYPFGLFVKERSFEGPKHGGWVWPRALSAPWLLAAASAALGEVPSGRAGSGEDFFALRPYRAGDPPARVAWRRAAAGRPPVVRELEAMQARRVTLVLQLDAAAARAGDDAVGEHTLALVTGLLEALAAKGMAVGLLTHGVHVPAQPGKAADLPLAGAVLDALAALDWHRPLPPLPRPARLGPALGLVGLAAVAGGGAGATVRLDAEGPEGQAAGVA